MDPSIEEPRWMQLMGTGHGPDAAWDNLGEMIKSKCVTSRKHLNMSSLILPHLCLIDGLLTAHQPPWPSPKTGLPSNRIIVLKSVFSKTPTPGFPTSIDTRLLLSVIIALGLRHPLQQASTITSLYFLPSPLRNLPQGAPAKTLFPPPSTRPTRRHFPAALSPQSLVGRVISHVSC
jgi:hypothetical protein